MSVSPPVVMYTTAVCPFCVRAEKLLLERGARDIQKIRVDADPKLRDEMLQKTSRRTVPQIFIGDLHIGGCDDLIDFDRAGKLIPLLSGEEAGVS